MADTFARRVFNVMLGQSTRLRTSPALGGAGVAGVVLTTGAGAWGAYADLIAAAAVATEFWVCGEGVYTPNGAQNFQFDIYNTTLTSTLASWSVDVTAVTVNIPPFMCPLPIYCAGSTQVQGRAGGAAAKTINAYVIYAIGL
jgi:hypothetical protein